MNLIYPNKPRRWSSGVADLRSIAGWVAGVAALVLVALFLGVFAAVMPPSLTARLVFLLAGVLIFVMALALAPGASLPGILSRRLLLAWIVVAVVWPPYLSYHGLPGPGISPTRLVYWTLLGVWFFWFVGSRDMRAHLSARLSGIRPFVWLLVAYLAWNFLCAVASKEPLQSLMQMVRALGGPVLILLITLSCLRDRRDVELALLLVVLAALMSVGVGLAEAVKKKNLFFELVPSLFPQGTTEELVWARELIADKSRDGQYRVASTFVHPLTFGEFLAMSLAAAIYLAGFSQQAGRRLLGLVGVPLIVAGIYVSHTRSTMLALGLVVIGLVATLGFRAVRQRRSFGLSVVGFYLLVAVPIAVLVFGAVALEFLSGRSTIEAGSSLARLTMFRIGTGLVLDQPLLGYGPGFAAVTLGRLPGLKELTIDSYYLSVALESGIPGLLAFVGLLAYPVFAGLGTAARMPGREGALLAVLAVAVAGFALVKLALSQPDNLAVAFLFVGLLGVAFGQGRKPVANPALSARWMPGVR